jgi:ribonuclease P protein component
VGSLALETHLSTKSPPAGQDARISFAHEQLRRPESFEITAAEGPPSPDAMNAGSAERTLRPHAFPKNFRLLRRAEFRRVYEQGQRRSASLCTVFLLSNGLENSRLGITVTGKVGKAVMRNRIKRRMREIFRTHRLEIAPGWDIVVNPRAQAAEAHFEKLTREFLRLMPKPGTPPSPAEGVPPSS